jgi:cyanate permease
VTVVAAIGAKFLIPDWPESATFLTEEEKGRVIARLAADISDAHLNRLDTTAAKRIFSDWKIYLGIFMYMGVLNTGYASSFFIPSIIKDMGYTSQAAQVRSIPIFVVAAITTLLAALCSDRARHRFGFIIFGICTATVGYSLLLSRDTVPVGVRYTALFFVVCGCYCAQPIVIAWIQNNSSGHYKR